MRYILTLQRDSYLPLQVIREWLAEGIPPDAAEFGHPARGGEGATRAPADMSRSQLLEAAGIDDAELTELETTA
jgi:hypothetical protein